MRDLFPWAHDNDELCDAISSNHTDAAQNVSSEDPMVSAVDQLLDAEWTESPLQIQATPCPLSQDRELHLKQCIDPFDDSDGEYGIQTFLNVLEIINADEIGV